jgi:hypothetical protein
MAIGEMSSPKRSGGEEDVRHSPHPSRPPLVTAGFDGEVGATTPSLLESRRRHRSAESGELQYQTYEGVGRFTHRFFGRAEEVGRATHEFFLRA